MDMQLSDGADLDACRNAFQKLRVSRRAQPRQCFRASGPSQAGPGMTGCVLFKCTTKIA